MFDYDNNYNYWKSPCGVEGNMLACDTQVASSISSCAITFTVRLGPLVKNLVQILDKAFHIVLIH